MGESLKYFADGRMGSTGWFCKDPGLFIIKVVQVYFQSSIRLFALDLFLVYKRLKIYKRRGVGNYPEIAPCFKSVFVKGCPQVVPGKKNYNNYRQLTPVVRVQFSSQVPS